MKFGDNRENAYYFIREKIKSNNIVCLKNGNKILGVSYTEDGLRGIQNKTGRYPYSGATNVKDAYKKPKLKWLKVEKFEPKEYASKEESLWIDKAYRLVNMN